MVLILDGLGWKRMNKNTPVQQDSQSENFCFRLLSRQLKNEQQDINTYKYH